jgi:hypothetical protein
LDKNATKTGNLKRSEDPQQTARGTASKLATVVVVYEYNEPRERSANISAYA